MNPLIAEALRYFWDAQLPVTKALYGTELGMIRCDHGRYFREDGTEIPKEEATAAINKSLGTHKT